MSKWRFDRPEKEGTYYCILIHDEYRNDKPTGRKLAELATRYFGDAEECAGWLMAGEPVIGLAWTENTGSSYCEKVYAWTDLPPVDIELPEGCTWE